MDQPSGVPSLAAAARRWQRDSFRARGVFGSLRYFAGQLFECIRDSTPERRRSRFGDIDYDCDHAVDTTWARLPFSVRLREIFAERLYQPTVEEEFAEIMRRLDGIDLTTFTFVDLGSGKGRVLLMASMYPFARIVGVEVQPELEAIARRNIEAFQSQQVNGGLAGDPVARPGQLCRRIESLCADAREYDFPAEDLVLYLFNPFPAYVLREVLQTLAASAMSAPRHIFVLYNAPFEKQEFERIPAFEPCCETPQFLIYRVQPE